MTLYVGIDPGVRACGVAASDGQSLIGALWARSETKERLGDDVVDAAVEGVRRVCSDRRAGGDWVVGVEFPEVTRDRARGDAKTEDLLELCYWIGRVEQQLRERLRAHVVRVQVSTWKHNIKTEVLEHRLLRMVPPMGLSRAEHATITWPAPSYRHNVVDAVALARWLAEWPARNPSKNLKDFGRL